MSRQTKPKDKAVLQALPRRRFLQTLAALLGGIGLPVWAKSDKKVGLKMVREAEFYHVKGEDERS